MQDVRVGGRQSNSGYQYTLKSDDTELRPTARRLTEALKAERLLTDVDTDQVVSGVEAYVNIDHGKAGRLGITPAASTTRFITGSVSARCRRSTAR